MTRSSTPPPSPRTRRPLTWHALVWSFILAPVGLILALLDLALTRRRHQPVPATTWAALTNSALGLVTLAALILAAWATYTWLLPAIPRLTG